MGISDLDPLVVEHEKRETHRLLQELNNILYSAIPLPGHSCDGDRKRHEVVEELSRVLTGWEVTRYT